MQASDYAPKEAAKLLGFSVQLVLRLCRAGVFGHRVGRHWRITPSEVERTQRGGIDYSGLSMRARRVLGLREVGGSLPVRVKLGAEWADIVSGDPPSDGALGCLDTTALPWRVYVRPNDPIGDHVILLHEVLHGVDELLLGANLVPDRLPEDWIENAAPVLLHALASMGWTPVTLAGLEGFMAREIAATEVDS